jgi:hypothetical protein
MSTPSAAARRARMRLRRNALNIGIRLGGIAALEEMRAIIDMALAGHRKKKPHRTTKGRRSLGFPRPRR